MAQNLTDTRSRILDTDYAMELAELAKFQIMQQAVNAMMAQANSTPQSVWLCLAKLNIDLPFCQKSLPYSFWNRVFFILKNLAVLFLENNYHKPFISSL